MDACRLLLATNRPVVLLLFSHLAEHVRPTLAVTHVPATSDGLATCLEHVAAVAAAVLDVASDPSTILRFSQRLHQERPALPVLVLTRFPLGAAPIDANVFLSNGARSILDLHATLDVLRTLKRLVPSDTVLRIQLTSSLGPLLDTVSGAARTQGAPELGLWTASEAQLLQLLARGRHDWEIGLRMHLSMHTVKHHIDQLCRRVGARNRIELAAWAGLHGFYLPTASTEELLDR